MKFNCFLFILHDFIDAMTLPLEQHLYFSEIMRQQTLMQASYLTVFPWRYVTTNAISSKFFYCISLKLYYNKHMTRKFFSCIYMTLYVTTDTISRMLLYCIVRRQWTPWQWSYLIVLSLKSYYIKRFTRILFYCIYLKLCDNKYHCKKVILLNFSEVMWQQTTL